MEVKNLNSELELKKPSDVKSDNIVVPVTKKHEPEKTEILSERGYNSKTFQIKKGCFETKYYREAIHRYDDELNAFVEVDDKVEDCNNGDTFLIRKNDLNIIIQKNEGNAALFTMSRGKHSVAAFLNSPFGKKIDRPVPVLKQEERKIVFSECVTGADLECSTSLSGLSIGVIEKASTCSERISLRIIGDNVTCQWNDIENILQFISSETDEVVFEIQSPFMKDSFGMYSENVSFEIISKNSNECELTIVPDMGWVSSKNRAFPVRIECAVTVNEQTAQGIEFDRRNISADGKVAIGGSAVPLKMILPEQRQGVVTKKVNILFNCESVPAAEDKTYALTLNRITESENESTSTMIGANILSVGKNEYAFDVTSEYEADENITYSLQLCEAQDGELVATADSSVALMSVASTSSIATYAVTETDGNTEDDVSSGESGNLGSVGTYEVDLVSGRLNMEIKDFAWNGNRMPVTINHSYSGLHAFSRYSPMWNAAHTCFAGMRIGNGWRLNLMQSMVDTGLQKVNDEYQYTYTYTDEAGKETVFVKCECESGTCCNYEDADGFGYTYDTTTGMLKKGSETYYFSNGRLVRIIDEYNNAMQINYTNNKITSVKDGVGRTFVFGYSGSYLISITAPNGASIQYQYCGENLCCVTFPNGQSLSFSHVTASGQPDSVIVSGSDITSLKTYFSYTGSKVKEVSTGIPNHARSGRFTTFDYVNDKQTIVKEYDMQSYTKTVTSEEDVIHNKIYLHEHPEKNYSYYDAGDEGKIKIAGKTILPYTEPGMNIGNLKCENLLQNHNFTTSGTDIALTGWSNNLEGIQYRDIQYDPPEGMPGRIAAYLLSLVSGDRQRGMWQTVSLECGQSYVFSCYLKLDQYNSNPNHGVYLMAKSTNGSTVFRSDMISVRGDFQRVVLPFKVDSACGETFTVGIYIDGNVKAKAIAPQLERGTAMSPYNYLSSADVMRNIPTSDDAYPLTQVSVMSGKGVKETFTLSCDVFGRTVDTNGLSAEGQLIAVVYYTQTSQERRNNVFPQSVFYVPVYNNSTVNSTFAMMQFSKDQYRSIDYIEILCANRNNGTTLTFKNFQLVRNTCLTGLNETDFQQFSDGVIDDEIEYAERATLEQENDEKMATIAYKEVIDKYGNSLTGTSFTRGEFGTMYTERKFEDSNSDDIIGDEGNNMTSEFDCRGGKTEYKYDPIISKPINVKNRLEHETSYVYDDSRRIQEVVAANGSTVKYGYNDYDQATNIVRGDDQTYALYYDQHRKLTRINIGEQTIIKYNYKTGSKRLKTMIFANNQYKSLTYDRFGNVKTEVWRTMRGLQPSDIDDVQAEYHYAYDSSQNLVKVVDKIYGIVYNVNRSNGVITSIEECKLNESGQYDIINTTRYIYDSEGIQIGKVYIDANGNEQKYVFDHRDGQYVAVQLPVAVPFADDSGKTKQFHVVSNIKADHFGRRVLDELHLGKGMMSRKLTYYDGQISEKHLEKNKRVSEPQTSLVKQIEFADGRTIQYEYDAEERITKVIDSVEGVYEYAYDVLGQLLTETKNNVEINKITYDNYGNISNKNGVEYHYDSKWKDLLVQVGDGENTQIVYDFSGNPTEYLGVTDIDWEKGRQLKRFGLSSYDYNKAGVRIRKQTSTEVHEYVVDGKKIVTETVTDLGCCPKYVNEYLYGVDGKVCGLKHDGTAYYFYKNLQGDIITITDDSGAVVARYEYDAWGKCVIVSDVSGVNIATINPFRYRGYYYDLETGFYYLQSRYYNPEIGRFLNADIVLGANGDLASYNLFSYCGNEPIGRIDESGYAWWVVVAVAVAVVAVVVVVGAIHQENIAVSDSNISYNQDANRDQIQEVNDQNSIDMKYGHSTVKQAGCGAVAAHNAIILARGPGSSTLSEVISYMERRELTFGEIGSYFWNIDSYLKTKGFSPKTHFMIFNIDKQIKASTNKIGILSYSDYGGLLSGDGLRGHYVAIQYDGTQFKIINEANNPIYESSIDAWCKNQSYLRLTLTTI